MMRWLDGRARDACMRAAANGARADGAADLRTDGGAGARPHGGVEPQPPRFCPHPHTLPTNADPALPSPPPLSSLSPILIAARSARDLERSQATLRDPERPRALKRDPGDPERGGAGHPEPYRKRLDI